ncbi:MAG: ABC transporter ATP-binding protein [Candidatus Hydrogenedentota bacterium]
MLRVNSVTKFLITNRVLNALSFNLNKGSLNVVVGPNGAGKTTLLRLLTGLYVPDSGAIYLNEEILSYDNAFRRTIGFLSEFSSYYDRFTLSEYLDIFLSIYSKRDKEHLSFREYLLDKTSLTEYKNAQLGSFSKGMSQKVSIIRVLQHKPLFLFLDEPTSTLDPESAVCIRDLIRDVSRDCYVLVASHNLDEIFHLADELVLIKSGKKIFQGTKQEFLYLLKNNIHYSFEFSDYIKNYFIKNYHNEIPDILKKYYKEDIFPVGIEPARKDLLKNFFKFTTP